MKKLLPLFMLLVYSAMSYSQNLEDYFLSSEDSLDKFVRPAFLGQRIGTSPSIEVPGKEELHLIISHRFGRLDGGLYELFGLDMATMRMGFDYGISDQFAIGTGRSSFQKIYDFYLKYRLINQKLNGSPVSVTGYGSFNYISLRNYFPESNNSFPDRSGMSLLIPAARKFGESLAIQITPAWHRSAYIPELDNKSDIFAIGLGLRYKLTGMIHFTGEYYHILSTPYFNRYSPLTLGFDIDTGGHLFQLVFSNSRGIGEKTYFSDTRERWQRGEIYFGFNLIRVFYFNN